MERADYDGLWCDCAPADILRLILSRLVAGEYFVFRAVCKRWRLIEPMPPTLPPFSYISSPCLMNLKESGFVELFHPLYNTVTHKMNFPELRGCKIRCSKANWLLMSLHGCSMFLFNPFNKVKIELPDLREGRENLFHAWTFSCPPDSSSTDCFIVGFEDFGEPPSVCIIKVGQSTWTYHSFFDEGSNQRFGLMGCNNPIFFKNNIVYILGEKGNLGILSIKENSAAEIPTWKFYGNHFSPRKRRSIQKVWTAEDANNGGMLCVFLTHEEGKVEVWRYNMNGRVLERKQITSLDNKTLFVSFGASYLKPCIAQGLENMIYLPIYHDNKGVFFSLASGNFSSFDYCANKAFSSRNCLNFDQPRSCIWIEPEVNHVPYHDWSKEKNKD